MAKKKKPYWVTRAGEKIYYDHLEDEHLQNIILMLRRNLGVAQNEADAAWAAYAECRGDMAQYYGSHGTEEASERAECIRGKLRSLVKEAERRCLLKTGLAN